MEVEYFRDKKKVFLKTLRRWAVIVLFVAGGVAGWIVYDFYQSHPPQVVSQPTRPIPYFGMDNYLVDRWNASVGELTRSVAFSAPEEDLELLRRAMLPADRPEAAAQKLARLVQRACGKDESFERNMRHLSEKYPRSPWPLFASMERSCDRKVMRELLDLLRHSQAKINGEEAERLLILLVRTDDRDAMVRTLIKAAHPCVFFYDERLHLVRQGMSRNVRRCTDFMLSEEW